MMVVRGRLIPAVATPTHGAAESRDRTTASSTSTSVSTAPAAATSADTPRGLDSGGIGVVGGASAPTTTPRSTPHPDVVVVVVVAASGGASSIDRTRGRLLAGGRGRNWA